LSEAKRLNELERLELAAACVSDWNVWNALNNWNKSLSMEPLSMEVDT
jgi:hypothetical protein